MTYRSFLPFRGQEKRTRVGGTWKALGEDYLGNTCMVGVVQKCKDHVRVSLTNCHWQSVCVAELVMSDCSGLVIPAD